MAKRRTFEGKTYVFPDEATDAQISEYILGQRQPEPTTGTQPESSGVGGALAVTAGVAAPGVLALVKRGVEELATNPRVTQAVQSVSGARTIPGLGVSAGSANIGKQALDVYTGQQSVGDAIKDGVRNEVLRRTPSLLQRLAARLAPSMATGGGSVGLIGPVAAAAAQSGDRVFESREAREARQRQFEEQYRQILLDQLAQRGGGR